jgi:uncharacterized membrane protein YhaH (DUF805 family)
MNWYLDVIKRYFDFNGRSGRQEFWMFFAINFGIAVVLNIIGAMLDLRILGSLYSLAVALPTLGVGARRLHDIGKSGWWQLIAIVPLIGIIVLIVFWAKEGDAGDNQFGANPKAA